MDLGIAGDVVVVTGGGRGLGACMCEAFAREGGQVVVWDLDIESATSVAESITEAGGTSFAVAGDVCRPHRVNEIVKEVLERFGRIDVLVNCAGFSRDAPLPEMTDEQWDAVIGVCLSGPFYVTRAASRSMIENQYGRIINISSRSRLGDNNKSNYAAAKAGLIGLTAAWAVELGKHGITANAIAPGWCETARAKTLQYYDTLKEQALQRTLTARLGSPQDVAGAALYLAARQSGFITGEVITVAGGRQR